MPFTTKDLTKNLRATRKLLAHHWVGLKKDQWHARLYPECKTIAETLAHLASTDRAALDTFKSGKEPDYASFEVKERDPAKLKALLKETYEELMTYLETTYRDTPLETEVKMWGVTKKLGNALADLLSENYYHMGQISFIRIATDPGWDYYGFVYGGRGALLVTPNFT